MKLILKKQLIISSNDQVVYDSNLVTYNNNYFNVPFNLEPRKHYDVKSCLIQRL